MSGLIPLLLPSSSGGRPSADYAPIETGRRASLAPHSSAALPLVHRRQQSLPSIRTARRGSLTPPTALPIIPFTSMEWKKAIDEVKRKYLNRKYRACSARCCEILDNLKDPSAVEPVYLIYLHFYAASSFESCARPLSTSSNYRTMLLRDAQTHYNKADGLIQKTEDGMNGRGRSASSSSSTSSLHSPELSPSTRSSAPSTTLSSPRTSLCSVEEGPASKSSSRPVGKAKKKVSFSGLNDLIEFQPEPYIRPDSPTLGWEDDMLPPSADSFPLFVEKNRSVPAASPESPVEHERPSMAPLARDSRSTEEAGLADDKFDLDSFLQNRSMNKIRAQLSGLRSQITFHRDGVDAMLAVSDDTPTVPTVPIDIPPVPPTPFTPPRPARANTCPTEVEFGLSPSGRTTPWTASALLDSFPKSPSFDIGNPRAIVRPASAASMIRCADEALQQRIERLRAGGWRRKRFDTRRYEVLREQVLGELGA
ncbi:hypothetical protein GGS23DRAFT_303744 [Durotheca rogersii]|uniref:uncharacterized protein n=1 Tax=Durotheca rogersii TaxID=419775 RepID=UPI002220CBBE|nr:uncharacterized protein GGS23DRAFT_303744 [Durotheca rogersii]KAI5867058.1 hypothetical protein GGS23DRAFT_303744 [Durotheca rogersii]